MTKLIQLGRRQAFSASLVGAILSNGCLDEEAQDSLGPDSGVGDEETTDEFAQIETVSEPPPCRPVEAQAVEGPIVTRLDVEEDFDEDFDEEPTIPSITVEAQESEAPLAIENPAASELVEEPLPLVDEDEPIASQSKTRAKVRMQRRRLRRKRAISVTPGLVVNPSNGEAAEAASSAAEAGEPKLERQPTNKQPLLTDRFSAFGSVGLRPSPPRGVGRLRRSM